MDIKKEYMKNWEDDFIFQSLDNKQIMNLKIYSTKRK